MGGSVVAGFVDGGAGRGLHQGVDGQGHPGQGVADLDPLIQTPPTPEAQSFWESMVTASWPTATYGRYLALVGSPAATMNREQNGRAGRPASAVRRPGVADAVLGEFASRAHPNAAAAEARHRALNWQSGGSSTQQASGTEWMLRRCLPCVAAPTSCLG